jgi:hypothetical protein
MKRPNAGAHNSKARRQLHAPPRARMNQLVDAPQPRLPGTHQSATRGQLDGLAALAAATPPRPAEKELLV